MTNLSPFTPATIEGYRVGSLIFEPLARVDPVTDEMTPWLAKRWTRLPHGRGVRVELRAGVTFHDGRALDAAAVAGTLEAFRDPKNKAATWQPLWAGIIRARVTGPLVVEFDTERLSVEGLRNLLTGLRILPAHRPAADLVGTGPFRAPTWSGGRIELQPNSGWWRGSPPDFDLTFRPVADAGLARDLVGRGELDAYALGAVSDAGAIQAGPGEGVWLDLNVRREPFTDPNVRRALLRAWDRADLNQKIFGGRRRVALDTFDPRAPWYPGGAAVAFDPARARRELRRAGWVAREGGLHRGARAFAFEVLVSSNEQERWVSLLQRSFGEVGVTVTTKRTAMDGAWWRRLRAGDFDAAAGGGRPAPAVNADAWSSRGAYNLAGWTSAALDRLLARLDFEFDPRRRRSLERAAVKLIRDDVVQLPGLIAPRGRWLISPRLTVDPDAPEDAWRWRVNVPR